jgi:hypothetical protein
MDRANKLHFPVLPVPSPLPITAIMSIFPAAGTPPHRRGLRFYSKVPKNGSVFVGGGGGEDLAGRSGCAGSVCLPETARVCQPSVPPRRVNAGACRQTGGDRLGSPRQSHIFLPHRLRQVDRAQYPHHPPQLSHRSTSTANTRLKSSAPDTLHFPSQRCHSAVFLP